MYREKIAEEKLRMEITRKEEELRREVQQKQARICLERLKDQGELEALQAAEEAYQANPPQGNACMLNENYSPIHDNARVPLHEQRPHSLLTPLLDGGPDIILGGSSAGGISNPRNQSYLSGA